MQIMRNQFQNNYRNLNRLLTEVERSYDSAQQVRIIAHKQKELGHYRTIAGAINSFLDEECTKYEKMCVKQSIMQKNILWPSLIILRFSTACVFTHTIFSDTASILYSID
jgi:hypothetical protein